MAGVTVKELIEHLKTYPGNLRVVYECCSEQKLLELIEIKVKDLCKPRNDYWVYDYRKDKESETYLVLPGN